MDNRTAEWNGTMSLYLHHVLTYKDTSTTLPSEGDHSVWKVIFALLQCATSISCIVGNSMVISAVITLQNLHNPGHWLIVSLAVSDLLVGLIVMPLSIMYNYLGRWPLGSHLCSTWVSLDVISCTASILNLMVLSVDRYLVITRPFAYTDEKRKKSMYLYISAAWTGSLLISVTPLFARWGAKYDGIHCDVNQSIGYQLYATLGAFYVPSSVMVALYFKICSISRRIFKEDQKLLCTVQLQNLELDTVSREGETNCGSNAPPNIPSDLNLSPTIGTHLSHCEPAGNNDCICSSVQNSVNIKDCQCKHESNGLLLPENNNGTHYNQDRNSISSIERQADLRTNTTKHKNSDVYEALHPPNGRRRPSMNSSQAVKTLGLVMGAFTFCWLPFFIIALTRSICGNKCLIPDALTTCFTWLGYFNSTLNPVIYASSNTDFRIPMREMICFRCSTIKQVVRQSNYQQNYGPPR